MIGINIIVPVEANPPQLICIVLQNEVMETGMVLADFVVSTNASKNSFQAKIMVNRNVTIRPGAARGMISLKKI